MISPDLSLLLASACVGFLNGLLRVGTGGATTSDIAGRGPAPLVGGGAVVPVGTAIVHLKQIRLDQLPSSLAMHFASVNGTIAVPLRISNRFETPARPLFAPLAYWGLPAAGG